MAKPSLDLHALARQAMRNYELEPFFSEQVQEQVKNLSSHVQHDPDRVDLRHLLWSSIDNVDSRDLDQIEFVEQLPHGNTRLLVAIADVSASVPIHSPIDEHALTNTTAVYTGVETFMMLPDVLCTDKTSLLPNKDRLAMVIELEIADTGKILTSKFYPAIVNNKAKLNYEAVGAFLSSHDLDDSLTDKTLQAQLHLQDSVAQKLRELRYERGALDLETIEATPKMENEKIVALQVPKKNRARELIEDFMIAANSATAQFLENHQFPFIRRVVKKPRYWTRIVELARALGTELPVQPDCKVLSEFLQKQKRLFPKRFPDLSLAMVKLIGPGEYEVEEPGQQGEGHFGLATSDYTHSTAPNRRYADLISQRLLKACISKQPAPYAIPELYKIAAACTNKSNAAQKVERFMRKAASAVFMQPHIGETFSGMITGASDKGTYVRLLEQPVEGRVVRGEKGMRVGDEVRVKLLSTEPEKGFIDFAGAP